MSTDESDTTTRRDTRHPAAAGCRSRPAVGQRLDADAEHALHAEDFADGEGAAALADLEPQRLSGHDERPGEGIRDLPRVDTP